MQGPGQPTLPLFVFGSIRRGITPQINAIASLILLVTLSALAVVYLVFRAQSRQSARPPDDAEAGTPDGPPASGPVGSETGRP